MKTMIGIVSACLLLTACENLGTVRVAQPALVTAYLAAATVDYHVTDQALSRLKGDVIGQPDTVNGFAEADVHFNRGAQVWTSRVVQEIRIALPADAVRARHAEASNALEAFARYAATRADRGAARLFVTSPSSPDRAWMVAQLRRAGATGPIDENALSYTAIGWTTPALVRERNVDAIDGMPT